MLYVRSKLDLGLDASELTGLVKRYGVWTVQDVISRLKFKKKSYHWSGRPVNSSKHIWWLEISFRHKNCTTVPQTDRQTVNFRERRIRPARKADWAGLGLGSLRSGPSRRTCVWAEGSRSRPPPALWTSCCGPASSLTTHSTATGVGLQKRDNSWYEHSFFVLQYSKVWFQRKEMIKKQWDKLSPCNLGVSDDVFKNSRIIWLSTPSHFH